MPSELARRETRLAKIEQAKAALADHERRDAQVLEAVRALDEATQAPQAEATRQRRARRRRKAPRR